MKTKIYLLVLFSIFCNYYYSFAQLTGRIQIDQKKIELGKKQSFDYIYWGDVTYSKQSGSPELPLKERSYVIPINASNIQLIVQNINKVKLSGLYNIYPVQMPIPTNYQYHNTFTEPDKKIYESENPYPDSAKRIEIISDILYMGYRIITIQIQPFEYIPKLKELYICNFDYQIKYSISKQSNDEKIETQNQTVYRYELNKKSVQFLVENPEDLNEYDTKVKNITQGKIIQAKTKGISKIKAISVLDEQVPNYIIITSSVLKPAFQSLADWKTKKGIFTIIKTVEDIAQNYQGNDLQEKIRNYIIDSRSKWGDGLYVLLGGDATIIPARIVGGVFANKSNNHQCTYPTDMYYSTYLNSWNQNTNSRFNEIEYTADAYGYFQSLTNLDNSNYSLGVILGRIPVETLEKATICVNKIISYEKATNISDINYFKNNLYSDAYMSPNNPTPTTQLSTFDLSSIKSYVSSYVPSYVNNKYIYDGVDCSIGTSRYPYSPCPNNDAANSIELNRANFLSCLNSGANFGVGKFHFIYHMDHAGAPSMGTSSIDKSQVVSNSDMDNLSNGNFYQILLSSGCHPANFSEDCIAEHYLNNPNGGGVAFIGNTDAGWTNEYQQLRYFINAIYNMNRYDIGSAFQYSLNGTSYGNENVQRKWRLHLLGDPEMQVWTNTPQTLVVTPSPAVVLLGEESINVTISNLPSGQKAMICVQKGSEVYSTQEVSANGTYTINFIVNTPGTINITVTAHNFIPSETTVQVQSTTDPHPFAEIVDFSDGISNIGVGNCNGKNDAGESIEMGLKIKNNGINPLVNASVSLCDFQPYITFANQNSCNSYNIGTLNSGESTYAYFNYVVNKNTPEILLNSKNPITLGISIADANNYSWVQNFNIDVFIDNLKQGNKTITYTSNNDLGIEAGETVRFNIDLKNVGKAPTKGLKAKITANSSYVQSCNTSWHDYPVINLNEVKQANVPFEFVALSNNLKDLKFNLTIENEYGKQWTDTFSLYRPPMPSGLDFNADSTEIYPIWNYIGVYSGFNVYRCNSDEFGNPLGNYEKINPDSVTFRYYIDKNLQKLTKYLYKVSAISKSGNEGILSDPLLAWTSLAVKKFHYDFGAIRGGITTADINNDGKKEIFASTRAGNDGAHLLGVNCNGEELFNIDGNATTLGGFGKMNGVSHGTPAVSEMALDGTCKIYGTTRDYSPFNLYCYLNKDNDNNGKPDLLGPNNLPSNIPTGNITGAILSNMDNSQDGSLEPTVVCENGHIALFNSDLNLQNIINQTNSSYYSAIAVADLDGGTKEVIKSNNDGVYIWDNTANPYKGINNRFYTFTTSTSSPSSVIVCDIDNNDKKDILTTANSKVYAIRTDIDNTLVTGWNQPTITTTGQISVGDLNHDGKLEIVTLGTNTITVLDNNGNILSSLIIPNLSPTGTPIIADVDGDSDNEIIVGSTSGLNKYVHAFNIDLSKVLGFPLKIDETAYSVPSVSDINGDGKNEIVLGVGSWIYIWKTNGIANNVEWGSIWHNQHNTNEYTKKCIPLTIMTTEIWNSDKNLCGGLTIKSGSLTINNNANIIIGSASMVTVMSGATLIIDSGKISNCNVSVLSGGTLILKNNGVLDIRSNGEFNVEQGAIFENQYGSVE